MTALSLSARDRRALRVGTWILLPALLVTFVGRPILDREIALRRQLQSERETLARERGLLRASRTLAGRASPSDAFAARVFSGPDSFTVSAGIGRYARRAAEAAGLRVASAESRVASAHLEVLVVEAELRAAGRIRDLDAFVRAIESEHRVSVARLAISAAVDGPTVPQDEEAPLTFAMTLRGVGTVTSVIAARQSAGAAP